MSEDTARTESPNRRSTVDAVVEALSLEILDGQLAPGEELREVELSERLGVSRATLREAVAQLSYRGLLERQLHKSVRVRVVTVEDAADLFYMRSLLEGDAVRRLAVDSSRWPHIEVALRRLESVAQDSAWSQVAESDIAFHRSLVKAAASPRLTLAHGRLVDELRLMLSPGRHYVNAEQMARAHRDLFEAIRSADIDVAMAAIRHHLELGAERIITHLSGEADS